MGRVSTEKNIEAFLKVPSFHKVVVGDGPDLARLKNKYKNVQFVGRKQGIELAMYYANADIFAFPSKTDTFGLVMIEAMASGTPVAAYALPHNYEIVPSTVGSLNDDLETAMNFAVKADRDTCVKHVQTNFTWEIATKQFVDGLVAVRD